MRAFFAAALLLCLCAGISAAGEFSLEMPLTCDLGKTCWVQQYPDHDPAPTASDYTCGAETYDGHDGTDIRLSTIRDKVDVVASAAGTVKGMRDGLPDHIITAPAERENVKGIECGNGVVLDHGNGWETQYCHMRAGSIAVNEGEKVATGQKLGEVGFSGDVQFPHVHLTVRKNGQKIDPFSGPLDALCGQDDNSLWSETARKALQYQSAQVIDMGFAGGRVDADDVQNGIPGPLTPKPSWVALVAYVSLINVQPGDSLTLGVSGPQGELAKNTMTPERNKATFFMLAGKKRPASGWPKGHYVAEVSVTRAGQVVQTKTIDAVME